MLSRGLWKIGTLSLGGSDMIKRFILHLLFGGFKVPTEA